MRFGGSALLIMLVTPATLVGQSPLRPFEERIEIRRTGFGVPHLLADDLEALGFGLAWVQLEDYGTRLAVNLVRARGEMAKVFGRDSIESDFIRRQTHQQTTATWTQVPEDVRKLYQGFAGGVNRYVSLHRDEFPEFLRPDFTGVDVAALWVETGAWQTANSFRNRMQTERRARADSLRRLGEGSNAWAFGPSRTASGRAILLRNPHLDWDAGYYEVHVTVPGVLNFYGDFRVGYPFFNNGGFNDWLGWATTNNDVDHEEVYAFEADSARPDHYLLDGRPVPLTSTMVAVEYRHRQGLATETRQFWYSPLGPVVDRSEGKVVVVKAAGWQEFRKGEQFLRMMQARNLEEWKTAMRIRAATASNFTYADRDGNIYFLWNGSLPDLPLPSGGDTVAVAARGEADIWQNLVPFDSLPQVLNPPRGYLQNANDPPHYTSLGAVLDSTRYPATVSRPALGLRGQLSHLLANEQAKVSLEDVARLKHSPRMLAGERFTDPLVAAVRGAQPSVELTAAADLLERWDRSVRPEARGAVLFEAWYNRYLTDEAPGSRRTFNDRWRVAFAEAWDPARPIETPTGLADPAKAVRSLEWAMADTKRLFGSWDVAWGSVNRIRLGNMDLPANGCTGQLGCFRVLWMEPDQDGKRRVRGGDGWMIGVEFGETPRAWSIMAYGQSSRPESEHHLDQLEMFTAGTMKPVAFSEEAIIRETRRRYRPGAP